MQVHIFCIATCCESLACLKNSQFQRWTALNMLETQIPEMGTLKKSQHLKTLQAEWRAHPDLNWFKIWQNRFIVNWRFVLFQTKCDQYFLFRTLLFLTWKWSEEVGGGRKWLEVFGSYRLQCYYRSLQEVNCDGQSLWKLRNRCMTWLLFQWTFLFRSKSWTNISTSAFVFLSKDSLFLMLFPTFYSILLVRSSK